MQRPDSVKQGDKFRVVGGDCPFGEYKDGDIIEYQCETLTNLLFFAKGIEGTIDWTDVEPLTDTNGFYYTEENKKWWQFWK